MSTAIEILGTLRQTSRSQKRTVAGFRVTGSLMRLTKITPSADDTVSVVCTGSGVADEGGAFRLTIDGAGEPASPVKLKVVAPDGTQLSSIDMSLDEVSKPITLRVQGLERLSISPSGDSARGERVIMRGRVIAESGDDVASALPVVIWGVALDDPAGTTYPVIVTQTQSGGYFSADWVSTPLAGAFGRVAGSDPIAIRLDDAQRLPLRVLLVLDLPDEEDQPDHRTVPAMAPTSADLTANPAEFSQDLGRGCVDLTTPNRAVEEFIYTMVVRMSEPDVKGVTFGGRRIVPPSAFTPLLEASAIHEAFSRRGVTAFESADIKDLSLDVESAIHLVSRDTPPTLIDIQKAGWLSEISWVKDLIGGAAQPAPVRLPLDGNHPIDWDDTPTVYQAITIARGHILEFREVWRADGYSLGDLLHSLPLAPGQRRQVAIVDWERRTTTTREDALEFEEQLNALSGRDRDISEIVGSHLSEEQAAGSSNSTWGVAGGIGAGFIGTGFGIFGGVAGSHGGSASQAWQDSSRSFAGDSLQSLRDRVMQRASSVRDQRATVVQTAAQGETMRAETETVGNYNHCHAMTVEYFEVLRHFLITHEIADVRECLFVPLPLREFDRAKVLRWQTPLAGRVTDRSVLPGFNAIRRVADNWVGWDYPVSRYSEDPPEVVEGELRISFVLPRPRDAEDGAFQVEDWKPYGLWLWEDAFELWTRIIQEGIADISAANIARRDRQFRKKVAPEIAKRVVDRLRFWYVDDNGGETEVPLDATLVSRYAEGTPLYVSLRPRGGLPPVPREQISQLKITLDTEFAPPFNIALDILPPNAQVIVHSGKARYQTEHKQFVLFDEPRILNDLSATDAVYIATPTSWAETRNPREEDRQLADRLVAHLNNHLEWYHQVIWAWLDPERRFMLLDGILMPGLGGKSVASVVENRVIGIAGNSMIFPLAPGIRIDPRVNNDSEGDLRDLYAADSPPAIRISVPTRGVYAEAILGDCNGCEEIDDSRYWRWTDAGMLAPPEIEPVDTGSRADDEEALTPTPLPTPLVQIQNAPELPTPVGLADVFKVLAKPDIFTDITGLEGTQKNAKAAFDSALSAASSMASQAAGLAKQNISATNGERMLDRIGQARTDGLLTPGKAQELSQQVLETIVGEPSDKADKKADSPTADPDVQKVIDKAAQSDKADIKVSTNDESIEMSFDGGDTLVGAGNATAGVFDTAGWIDEPVVADGVGGGKDAFTINSTVLARFAQLKAGFAAKVAAIDGKFVRANPADTTKYQFFRRLRIAYPADAKDAKKVAGAGRIPLAVIVHGQHASWQGGVEVRNNDGYNYLQEALAKQGIASVSVDTNAANFFNSLIEMRALMTLGAIDAVHAMDADPSSRFHHRIDFDHIGLLGHSRGGDAVVRAALLNKPNKHGVIRAVVSLSPTDFTGALADRTKRNALDIAAAGFYLVMYGGLDGDVTGEGGPRDFGGTGFRHYDRASAPKAMVYVPGCNHNRFNRNWSTDESGIVSADAGRLHSRADHETVLTEYVGALFGWKLLGMSAKSGLFTGLASNSLGHDISIQWTHGAQLKLIEDFEKATGTIGTRTIHAADVAAFADVTVGPDTLELHTSHQTRILAVQANLPGPAQPALELAFPAAHRDWSGFQVLQLGLGTWIDVTSPATIAAGSGVPPLNILVIDGDGKTGAAGSVSFTSPTIPGKPVFHVVNSEDSAGLPIEVNVSLHRLSTVSITLGGLGVKLKDVRSLLIQPAAGFGQRIFIDSIWLVK